MGVEVTEVGKGMRLSLNGTREKKETHKKKTIKNGHVSKKDIQMANIYMKWSTLLIIKITMKYNLMPIRLVTRNKTKLEKQVLEWMWRNWNLCTVGGNVIGLANMIKQCGSSSEN